MKNSKTRIQSSLTKDHKRYTMLFAMTYFISYLTRINFAAIISEVVSATGYSKEMLSIAITSSFVTYGVGQCISGFLGDRFSPKGLISIGLATTVLINMLVPVLGKVFWMIFLWGINGFAQSLMWPPLVKIMTCVFNDEEYKHASVKVSWASSLGTMTIYLVSPILISVFNWKAVFFFSASAGLTMLAVWYRCCPEITEIKKEIDARQQSNECWFSASMIPILFVIILQGMLRDGVTTWIPSFVAETYDLKNSIAILTSVILPIFAIICFNITAWLNRTTFKNPVVCSGVLLLLGSIAGVVLLWTIGKTPVVSVGVAAVFTGTMHGVNLLVTSLILPWFTKFGNISTISGILNSCTYVGSAISTYGIAVLSEKIGWGYTIALWSLVAFIGMLVCLLTSKSWEQHYSNG